MIQYIFLVGYILIMVLIGIQSAKKIKNSGDFLVAGKKGTLIQITGSLLATILGSSAILGSADLAVSRGWAAAWLLLSASAGLLGLYFFAGIVSRRGEYTLSQLIGSQYGVEAKRISAIIIPIAWIGVIAAQIIGGAKVMNSFFHLEYSAAVWGIGLLFIFYTVIGGQISVIKTDLYQSFIIIAGVIAVALFLYFNYDEPASTLTVLDFPFNSGFQPTDLLVLILTYSTTFLVGPDIYSRLFCAASPGVAKKSVLLTALVLLPFSFMITYLGVFAAHRFPDFNFDHGSSLLFVLINLLPGWAIGILVAALLSAVMSSASTTLLTSSTIISEAISGEIKSSESIGRTKIVVLIMGLFSILLALNITSIIQSLLLALTFFSGAFILPVVAGLLGYGADRITSNLAILTGGTIALTGKIYSLGGDVVIGNVLIISSFIINGLILFFPAYRKMFRLNKK